MERASIRQGTSARTKAVATARRRRSRGGGPGRPERGARAVCVWVRVPRPTGRLWGRPCAAPAPAGHGGRARNVAGGCVRHDRALGPDDRARAHHSKRRRRRRRVHRPCRVPAGRPPGPARSYAADRRAVAGGCVCSAGPPPSLPSFTPCRASRTHMRGPSARHGTGLQSPRRPGAAPGDRGIAERLGREGEKRLAGQVAARATPPSLFPSLARLSARRRAPKRGPSAHEGMGPVPSVTS